MTVNKIQHPDGSYGPDLTGIEDYESVSLNPDGETYTVKIKPEKELERLKKAHTDLLDRLASANSMAQVRTAASELRQPIQPERERR